jgi:ubiquitin carboxyl-terminal hydrolase 34
MRDQCFGSQSDSAFFGLPKMNNAYMLFYQRSSSLDKLDQQYRQHDAINPVRLGLPPGLEHHMQQTNELFLRSYCIQDSHYALFLRQVLGRMKIGSDEGCSEDHSLETSTIRMILEYVRQISGRWKDLPYVEDTLKLVEQYARQCSRCALTAAHWFHGTKVLDDVIVKNPYQAVRKSFCGLFTAVFSHLRAVSNANEATDEYNRFLTRDYFRYLQRSVEQLAKLFETVTKTSRCWQEYFTMLNNIQKLGEDELTLVLDEEFIEKCIDIVMIHLNNPLQFPLSRRLKGRYIGYLNGRERNRPYNHNTIFTFLVNLIVRVDINQSPDGDDRVTDKKTGLSSSECEVLGISKTPWDFEWMRRLICGQAAPRATDLLISHFATDHRLAGATSNVIGNGLNDKDITVAVTFLRPTLVFCEHCSFENQVIDLVQQSLEGVATSGLEWAREYLHFVERLTSLENSAIDADPGWLMEDVLRNANFWAPPLLVAPSDTNGNVRGDTVSLLARILFTPLQAAELEDPRLYLNFRKVCQDLAEGAMTFVQTSFLNPRPRDNTAIQPGQTVQVIQVVDRCLQYFDLEDPRARDKVAEITNTMAQLKAKADMAVETLSAVEWQNDSSDLAEVSAEEYEDTLSP